MTEFEYYHTFETILYGLAFASLFTGASRMVIYSKQITFYWVHVLAVLTMLFTLVEAYFSMYRIQEYFGGSYGTDTKWLFFFVKVAPVGVLYMGIMTLFPDDWNHPIDFKVLFEERDRKILSYLIAFPGVLLIRNVIVFFPERDSLEAIVSADPFFSIIVPPVVFIVLALIAMFHSRRHQLVEIIFITIFVYITWLMSMPAVLPQ